MLVQECMIHESANVRKSGVSYHHYSSFSYDHLLSRHSPNHDYFINGKGLTFANYVGCKYLTGNELLYYPELAQQLRNLKEYPTLTRMFEINKEIEGLAFIKYFCEYTMECYKAFEQELSQASQVVNHLIHLYGTKRYMPIVNGIVEEEINSYSKEKKLVINGVAWAINDNSYRERRITDYIDLHSLLNISRADFRTIKLEDAFVGTPFIAVRIVKAWPNKGHVHYYNLDTLQRVWKADIVKWKKP